MQGHDMQHVMQNPAKWLPALIFTPYFCLQESGLLGGRKYTARALTEGDHVIHRFVGQFKLVNGLEVYLRSFNVFNLTLWDDIIQQFGELTDKDVLVRHSG